ncbi:MAG: hypothetical protein GXP49_01745 [Deltaproteobacteria bacterium]|nr:hypothetical protein [Deltaproteobacteria bacterium]
MNSKKGKACYLHSCMLPFSIGLLLQFLSYPVWAQASHVFGFDSASRGMAGARTAIPGGPGDLYYNPANLVWVDSPELSVQFGYQKLSTRQDLETSDAYGGTLSLPKEGLSKTEHVMGVLGIGLLLPLDSLIENEYLKTRMSIGMFAEIPTHTVIHQRIPYEDTPMFFMFEPPERTLLYLGGAVSPVPWLSLGAGLIVSFAFDVGVDIGVDTSFLLGDKDASLPEEAVDVSSYTFVTPTAGMTIDIVPGFKLGFSFRGKIVDKMHLVQLISTKGYFEENIKMIFDRSLLVQPDQLSAGISYDFGKGLVAAADLTWFRWDDYRNPAGKWTILRETPGANVTINDVKASQAPEFKSTFSPALGIEWKPSDSVRIRTGYRFSPTPAPDQGRNARITNLLDSDRHMFTMGATLVTGPGDENGWRYSLDLFLQYSWMEAGRYEKSEKAVVASRIRAATFSAHMLAFGGGMTVAF